jgi:hypothetical protein
MRRLHGGWLAALVLLVGGCGSGQRDNGAAPTPRPPSVAVPTLAVAAHTPSAPAAVDSLTVLVTSAEGVGSPGLDAIVSVLAARPSTEVVVVATETMSTSPAETGVVAQARGGETMSGFPAQVVNASAADAVAIALDELGIAADLVVVGIGDGAALGSAASRSPSVGAALAAARRGVPAIAVTAGDEHGSDVAGAGLALAGLFDLRLDELLDRGGVRVLTVPSCSGGTLRGPVEVPLATAEPAGQPDCTAPEAVGVELDDVSAHSRGYATIVDLDDQAIP